MSQCSASISTMCSNGMYQNCDLNLFNFFFIICLYYTLYSYSSIYGWLINLPIVLITLPFLPISLLLYLFYLFGLPLVNVVNTFFPSLSAVIIPFLVFFISGIADVRLSKLFKVR
jgi:hypothetical protein